MLPPDELSALIRAAMPDAQVEVEDLTGTRDHYSVTVTSAAFTGKSRLAQQRLVYAALGDAMRGPIHALALSTQVPDNDNKTAERS